MGAKCTKNSVPSDDYVARYSTSMEGPKPIFRHESSTVSIDATSQETKDTTEHSLSEEELRKAEELKHEAHERRRANTKRKMQDPESYKQRDAMKSNAARRATVHLQSQLNHMGDTTTQHEAAIRSHAKARSQPHGHHDNRPFGTCAIFDVFSGLSLMCPPSKSVKMKPALDNEDDEEDEEVLR